MKKTKHMKELLIAALLLLLVPHSDGLLLCSSNCTASTSNAFCTNQGYCSCTPGFVFSCNTPATNATTNSFLSPLTSSRPYYYILNSQTGVEMEYSITFSDSSNPDILVTYQPNFYTDEGMNINPQITYTITSYTNKPHMFTCTFRITLSNQPGTSQPENLIMIVNISSPSIIPSLSFSYSYSTVTPGAPIFLILGYVAGGLLILVSVVLIVIVYRRKSTNRNNHRYKKDETIVYNISHFQQFMPAALISIQDKKNLVACSVCLQEFDFNSTIRKTTCNHIFHSQCIDQWCVKNLSCPMCRTDLSKDRMAQHRLDNSRRESNVDWIMNSMVEQDEPSQIRNPLNGESIINNHDL